MKNSKISKNSDAEVSLNYSKQMSINRKKSPSDASIVKFDPQLGGIASLMNNSKYMSMIDQEFDDKDID